MLTLEAWLPVTVLYLWRLVVHWHHSDVKADPCDCFAKVVGYRQNKLDILGVRTDIHDWGHVSYFHEVHCMLESRKDKKM